MKEFHKFVTHQVLQFNHVCPAPSALSVLTKSPYCLPNFSSARMQRGDQRPELHGGGEARRGIIVADSGIRCRRDVAVSSSASRGLCR